VWGRKLIWGHYSFHYSVVLAVMRRKECYGDRQ